MHRNDVVSILRDTTDRLPRRYNICKDRKWFNTVHRNDYRTIRLKIRPIYQIRTVTVFKDARDLSTKIFRKIQKPGIVRRPRSCSSARLVKNLATFVTVKNEWEKIFSNSCFIIRRLYSKHESVNLKFVQVQNVLALNRKQ